MPKEMGVLVFSSLWEEDIDLHIKVGHDAKYSGSKP